MMKRPAQRSVCFFSVVPAAWALLFGASASTAQPAAMLENALRGVRSIGTLTCLIARKQSCGGVEKSSRCECTFDHNGGRCCYAYASPYEYTFTVSDSEVVGVNRKSKQGYKVKLVSEPARFRELLESVHLLGPLLQFGRMDTLIVSLKASIGDFLYFQRDAGAAHELIKADRAGNAVVLVETSDSTGAVTRQTVFEYDASSGKRAVFPRKVIIRQNPAGFDIR